MERDFQYRNLIHGLPDGIALDCLLRVPFRYHAALKSVCRTWKTLFSDHSFYAHRRLASRGEDFVCLVQSVPLLRDQSGEKESAGKALLAYGLTVYNATDDTWRTLPESPLLPAGIPMFSQCVAVDGKLVVLGGWDPMTLESVGDVYIYDFLGGGGWTRGASMSVARSFFACAAAGPFVYVAGGHDNQKNALRSAELYDPASDTWRTLPEMAEERDECQGFSTDGGRCFWVLSGYGTESQGLFDSSAEFYDSVRGEWTRIDGVWPYPNSTPRSLSGLPLKNSPKHEMTEMPFPALWHVDAAGNQHGICEYDFKERSWTLVSPMPEGIRSSSPCVTLIEGAGSASDRILVFGSGSGSGSGSVDGIDARHVAWVFDTRSKAWTPLETPGQFSGFVFSACSLHL